MRELEGGVLGLEGLDCFVEVFDVVAVLLSVLYY